MSKNDFIYRIVATDYSGEKEHSIVGHYLSNGLAKGDVKRLLPKLDEWDEIIIEKIMLGVMRAPSIVYKLKRNHYNDWKEISISRNTNK